MSPLLPRNFDTGHFSEKTAQDRHAPGSSVKPEPLSYATCSNTRLISFGFRVQVIEQLCSRLSIDGSSSKLPFTRCASESAPSTPELPSPPETI